MLFFDKHPFIRDLIWGFFEFAITFFAFAYFRHAIHEWCHLTVLQYFGGDGYIVNNIWGVGVHFTKMPTNVTAVAFAGGLGIALFYLFLMYMDWDDDPEQAAAFPPLILSQLFYGIVEGMWIFGNPDLYNQYASIAHGLGFGVGVLVSAYLLIAWLLRLDKKYSGK